MIWTKTDKAIASSASVAATAMEARGWHAVIDTCVLENYLSFAINVAMSFYSTSLLTTVKDTFGRSIVPTLRFQSGPCGELDMKVRKESKSEDTMLGQSLVVVLW